MVMEAQPSPQSVGREFVRQYYTLLNKAPNFLHRFYTNQSSFIHGDHQNRDPVLVIGQKNIYQKIQQLNFRDCHAKINQVDAQATLGNGVVVQVTGELSNDGQPMRRFTQTFVLAAQKPKNYYVHNDIFRYQDYCYDDENEVESRSENDEEQDNSESSKLTETGNNTAGTPIPQNPTLVATPTMVTANVVPPNVAAGITTPQQQMYFIQQQMQQQQQQAPQTVVTPNTGNAASAPLPQRQQPINITPTGAPIGQFTPQVNGIGHDDTPPQPQQVLSQPSHIVTPCVLTSVIPPAVASLPSQPLPQTQQPQLQQTPTGIIQQQISPQPQNQPAPVPIQQVQNQQHINYMDNEPSESVSPVSALNSGMANAQISSDSEQNVDQKNEPKTYAHLLRSSGSMGSSTSPVMLNQQTSQQLQQPSQQYSGSGGNTPQQSANQQQMQPQRDMMNQSQGLPQRNNSIRNKDKNEPFSERRSFNSYNNPGGRDRMRERDENQLFIGSVPPSATEEHFRELFSRFGNVVDLKIFNKNKGIGMRGGSSNYGFITYDNREAVKKCLNGGPVLYNDPDRNMDPVEINVEEKRSNPIRGGPNDLPPRQSNMSNNGPGMDRFSRPNGPRSLSNSGGNGGMIRNNNGGNNMMRGGGGNRPQGSYNNRGMDNRGPQNRGNSSGGGGGGNNFRR